MLRPTSDIEKLQTTQFNSWNRLATRNLVWFMQLTSYSLAAMYVSYMEKQKAQHLTYAFFS
ncbi:hypothetical protein FEV09_15305 [Pseudanabaena catenata USMAC16]|uniref:Uncharacterized protein n=2 Tax=Pseudanabaena TaxID=1152 RepID=L8MYH3_9CYAN|nr:hypothetical protein [Pseudanabaena catenata]ELS31834.1 hypothetical protein Pse7429DRAFT_3260 [Pseudanabaena biceps PCC 7429]MDG3495914.1 hypothetical protein [Pseudanabaena catenata USMAC16]